MARASRSRFQPPQPPRYLHLLDRMEGKLLKQETLTALPPWFVLELFSLPFVEGFTQIPGNNKLLTWLLITIPLGMMGAILVGLSSEFIRICQEHYRNTANKRSLICLGLVGSWLGLAGVGFPLSIVVVELWMNYAALGQQ
jgi:hypothetical protein